MYEIFENLLKEKHITAYQVAKATGISTGSLSDWKNGRSSPKADKLQKIADFFGVTVDYLLGNDTKKEPAVDGRPNLDDATIAFYNRYEQLSDEEKEDMRDYLALMEARRERRKKGE